MNKYQIRRQIVKNREDQGWVAKPGVIDSSTERFHKQLQEVIACEIIDKIEKIPEMIVDIGPYSHNFNNNTNSGNIIAILTLGQSLEICWRCGPRLNETGFQVKGLYQFFTLDGLVNYINTEWLPKVKKGLKSLRDRADLAKEIESSFEVLNHRTYQFEELTPLLKSVFTGFYGGGSKFYDMTHYYIISDQKGFITLDAIKDCTSYREIYKSAYPNVDLFDLRFISVAIRRDKNQAQIAHCMYGNPPKKLDGYGYNAHSRPEVGKTKWFSPKNIMTQLEEYVKGYPGVATLLANPDTGKKQCTDY